MVAFHCSPSINNRESRGSLSSPPQTKRSEGSAWVDTFNCTNIQLFHFFFHIGVELDQNKFNLCRLAPNWQELVYNFYSEPKSCLAWHTRIVTTCNIQSRERTPNSYSFSSIIRFLSPGITSRSLLPFISFHFSRKNIFSQQVEGTRVFYQLYTLQKSLA